MHVITKSALVKFWTKHPDARGPLQDWFNIMENQLFTDLVNLRETFASADQVGNLTVFNIGGNKYRLIVAIHYNRHKVFIRNVLTHAEYNRNNWKRGN
jgi:mRNA interferase HigB